MTKRKKWIVSLRAFAAMAVVMIHVIGGWQVDANVDAVNIRTFVDLVLFQTGIRWAVPIFLMISGSLLLDPEKEMTFAKIRKYIIRMLLIIAVFGFGFCFMESVFSHGIDQIPKCVLEAIFNTLKGNSWTHMWYVYMLIGLYLITMIIRIFTKYADEKIFRYTLIYLFVFSFVLPDINTTFQLDLFYLGYFTTPYSYLFYYLIGYYLTKRNLCCKTSTTIFCVGVLLNIVALTLNLKGAGVQNNSFIALYSTAIFSFAIDSSFLDRVSENAFMASLSKHSFSIYIIHPLFLNVANKMIGVTPEFLPCPVGELVFWAGTLILSWLFSIVISKIPGLKKIML